MRQLEHFSSRGCFPINSCGVDSFTDLLKEVPASAGEEHDVILHSTARCIASCQVVTAQHHVLDPCAGGEHKPTSPQLPTTPLSFNYVLCHVPRASAPSAVPHFDMNMLCSPAGSSGRSICCNIRLIGRMPSNLNTIHSVSA